MGANGKKLNVTTPSDREIVMTRVFDAPRELVFEAHTSCEHMKNWWGPSKYEIPECDIDFREGGTWHVIHRGPDGDQHEFRGEYRQIVRPEKIVWTFEWMGAPGQISEETLTLEEQDGKTLLTASAMYSSKEGRDGMMQTGMEEGAAETYERLDEYLESLKSRASR